MTPPAISPAADPPPPLVERLAVVRDRIAQASAKAGRDPAEVRLVGVTKTHPVATLSAALAAGISDLGENRVEEFVRKAAAVSGARWHFVGQLQSRKANQLVGLRHPDGTLLDLLIHAVDRISLIDRLQRLAAREDVVQRVLIEVNVGDDPRKGGCSVHEVEPLVAYAADRPNIAVQGLMTIPPRTPEGADPVEAARPHFARLRALRDRCQPQWPAVRELSMGMTADLEAAVEQGATMVRVGTALFGPRRTPRRPGGATPGGETL